MEVKRIIQDANIHTFFRSHEWDIVKRVWNYSHLKYSSCLLKSTSTSKCTKTVLFWNQPWLQGLIHDFPLRSRLSPKLSELYFEIKVDIHVNSEIEVDAMSCLEIKVVSKVRQNQLFLSTTQNAVLPYG